jgi:chemotaxis protein MotB
MSTEGKKVIVVKKKARRHEGHHGGAWKVAYADFVTAMMAFFLVMWLLGMSQEARDLIQGYFSNPVGFSQRFGGGGANPLGKGTSPTDIPLNRPVLVTREFQKARFEETAENLGRKIEEAGLFEGSSADVEITLTEQGLRIELMEAGEGDTFFEKASAALKPALESVLTVIAPELQALPNHVVIEGHTDALPFGGKAYSNWELSVDRANSARRILEESGLDPHHVVEVRGYAERRLKNTEDPFDPHNRRISVLLPYVEDLEVIDLSGFDVGRRGGAAFPDDYLPHPYDQE